MIKMTLAICLVFSTTLSFSETTGLKKVNFQDETSDKQDEGSGSATLSPEDETPILEYNKFVSAVFFFSDISILIDLNIF